MTPSTKTPSSMTVAAYPVSRLVCKQREKLLYKYLHSSVTYRVILVLLGIQKVYKRR